MVFERVSGKSVDTFCVTVNFFANVATSPLDVMRCRRVSSGCTGSGSVSLRERVSCDGNEGPINTNPPSKR